MPGHSWKNYQLSINDANPTEESFFASQPVELDVGELSRLQQLIIRPGESGGVLTQTEFEISKFCAEEKLEKRTSDRLVSLIKKRDFVIEDIHAETIRYMELLNSNVAEVKYQSTIYGRKTMANKKLSCI